MNNDLSQRKDILCLNCNKIYFSFVSTSIIFNSKTISVSIVQQFHQCPRCDYIGTVVRNPDWSLNLL